MKNKQIKLSGYSQISSEHLQSLTLLYTPLVGTDAIQFYLLLSSLIMSDITNYTLLTHLLKKSYEELDHYRELLEEYKLIRTYQKENDPTYYIDIQKPLTGLNFLNHLLYGRIYHAKLKEKVFQFMESYFSAKNEFKTFTEITKHLNLSKDVELLEQDASNYEEITTFNIQHDFDYTTFFKYQDQYLIPSEIIENQKILQKIGEYASIYNVDAKTMAKLVARSTLLTNNTLDFEKLVNYLKKVELPTDAEVTQVSHPMQYLKQKQNGINPNRYERQLIEKLITEYRFSYELINILLDYSLEKNDNRISEVYIEKIAATWIRNGIKTVEQAQAALQPKVKKQSKKEKMLESWEQPTTVLEVDQKILSKLLKKGENHE